MFPKFRRTRIRNLEPATLAELKQYIDSRLVPPEGDALGDTVRLDEFREPSAPSEDLQASREAVTFDTAEIPSLPSDDEPQLSVLRENKRFPKSNGVPSCAREPVRKQMQAMQAPAMANASLSDALSMLDESFADMLFRKIDERGMTDAQCYKKAGELSMDETKELLMKAGYALSHSSKFDIIIEFFIGRGNYDRFAINEALYEFDQQLI